MAGNLSARSAGNKTEKTLRNICAFPDTGSDSDSLANDEATEPFSDPKTGQNPAEDCGRTLSA